MFTGLVEDIGTIGAIVTDDGGRRISIAPGSIPPKELSLGDSIAMDGVCLTVTDIAHDRFSALAGAETLRITTLGDWKTGQRVNLERALALGDRLGGHMVLGHVDGVGDLVDRRDDDANVVFTFRAPASVARYLIPKGSVAIDGISLTVNAVDEDKFSVALIPHTVSHTALADKHVGARVNLEADMIGKYVERLVTPYRTAP